MATAAGWALGWTIGGNAGETLGGPVSAGVSGSSTAIIQWLVLRRRISHVGWWPWAGIGGWLFSVATGEIVATVTGGAAPATVAAPIGATLVALLQWLILRRLPSRTAWWIAANVLGFGLGGALVYAAATAVRGPALLAVGGFETLFGAMLGATLGAVTGFALVGLLQGKVE